MINFLVLCLHDLVLRFDPFFIELFLLALNILDKFPSGSIQLFFFFFLGEFFYLFGVFSARSGSEI